MGLLTLYSGTLLPWLGGAFWLVFADARLNKNNHANRLRQAGYGFFVGYAVLFLAVITSNKLTGSISWPHLMVFLLIFTATGAIAAWWGQTTKTAIAQPQIPATPGVPVKTLITMVSVLMAIHLTFIAVEILTQPVYPWDAWLAWVYRAKAWFMAGGISNIVSSADWATASSTNVYTINAWLYPLFPSIVPYWAALSLGRWSEILINLPVLYAGLAMGMALYGQCREYGLSILTSLVSCYLLYSIPLLGTHLALAGYADIWMAGFAGLGFVAIMRGSIMRNGTGGSSFQIALGFLMIIFSIWVKNEGVVWFLAAIVMLILTTCRPRVPFLILAGAVIAVLFGFALGQTHIEIPLIGKLGLIDDRLAIPFIGSFRLEAHNIWHAYWDNFINMGSWNLLWVAVAGSLLLGFKSPNLASGYRARRTALSFILIFLATQLFIFGLTDKGMWADSYTAINRLPIHFVPALLFAVIVIVHASLTRNIAARETQIGDA